MENDHDLCAGDMIVSLAIRTPETQYGLDAVIRADDLALCASYGGSAEDTIRGAVDRLARQLIRALDILPTEER